jgi:hypothetical protein
MSAAVGMEGAVELDEPVGHPVQLRIEDDLRRNRLTVFFRLLLGIPHYIWITLWSIAAVVVAIVNWFVTLIAGQPADWAHRFLTAYVRYAAHLNAYLLLVANPYPGFTGEYGDYPLDVQLPQRAPQVRWKTLLRIFLAIPSWLLSAMLGGGLVGTAGGGFGRSRGATAYAPNVNSGFLAVVCAFLGWFASLVRGQMPRGLRDAAAFSIGYGAHVLSYTLLLTDVYPDSNPDRMLATLEPPPQHPVRLMLTDDLRRSRLTTFFRLLLAIPHIVWLALWTIAAIFAAIANWFATLVSGIPAAALHRFLSAYVRYSAHVTAYLYLVANPFPGFVGAPGYDLDIDLPPRTPQNRGVTGFRIFLAIPAYLVNAALSYVLIVAAILMWFAGLVTGRAPDGVRRVGSYAIRYSAQFNAYLYLVTDVYPHASPLEGRAALPEPELQPVLEP